jgi:hypothetical protein
VVSVEVELVAFKQASEDYRLARLDVIRAGSERALIAARLHRSGLGYGRLAKRLGVTKSRAQQLCNRGEELLELPRNMGNLRIYPDNIN